MSAPDSVGRVLDLIRRRASFAPVVEPPFVGSSAEEMLAVATGAVRALAAHVEVADTQGIDLVKLLEAEP